MIAFTFNSPPVLALRPVTWLNGTAISGALPGGFNTGGAGIPTDTPAAAYVDAHRKLAIDAKWRGDGLIVLDNEAVANLVTLRACAAAVDKEIPSIAKTSYGPFVGEIQREDAIDLARGVSTDRTVELDATIRAYLPVYERLKVVMASVYMLGPAYVDRDLAYVAACDALRRRYFPRKTTMLAVWNCYEVAWNPPNSVLAPDVMTRYVAAIQKSSPAACVFDATPGRDDEFVRMLTA